MPAPWGCSKLRKPAPRSQGCEGARVLSWLDTASPRKFPLGGTAECSPKPSPCHPQQKPEIDGQRLTAVLAVPLTAGYLAF